MAFTRSGTGGRCIPRQGLEDDGGNELGRLGAQLADALIHHHVGLVQVRLRSRHDRCEDVAPQPVGRDLRDVPQKPEASVDCNQLVAEPVVEQAACTGPPSCLRKALAMDSKSIT